MKKRLFSLLTALVMVVSLVGVLPSMSVGADTALKVTQVTLGNLHSAAIKNDGSLWMWGYNYYGQLGNGTTTHSSMPIKIMDNVKSVSLGGSHSAAIKEDGSLWMWGRNYYGQLGNGTDDYSTVPIKIMDNVKCVSLGWSHSAAIKNDGSLWMWGGNSSGQLGNGTTTKSTVPIKIMDNVKSVSLGSYHSAAIKNDGSLWMWGYNYFGELGNGTTTNSTVPIKIMDNVKSVSLGDDHSSAITEDGSLWMWGDNLRGKLGNGTTTNSTVPIKIMDNVKSVSLGYYHSAAIKNDGSLWMWGYNGNGQLGNNGTTTDSTVPIKIMDNVNSVSLGNDHSAAIKNDGSLWMWGYNNDGQLGNGTTTDSTIPINITGNMALNDGYAIKLYSAMPALTVGVNQQVNCAVQLEKDGEVISGNDGVDFEFSVSDSSVLSVSGIRKDSDAEKSGENGTWFTLNGKKEGIAKLTITEINTGTVYYTSIQVSNGILSFSANCMPSYYDHNFEYNGYISGMYVDEFNFNSNESKVSFNVYNTTSLVGVVDVYDANGNLVDCEVIERFDGNYASSIKDSVVNACKLVADGFKSELMTYKQDSYSKKTTIIDLNVPKGGRIEVTNNVNYSDTCAVANACELTIESLLTFTDAISDSSKAKEISEDTVGKIIKNSLKENIPKLGGKIAKKLAEKTFEEVGVNALTSSMTDCVNSLVDVFNELDIDIYKLIIDSCASSGISVAESALKDAMGPVGIVLDGLFLINDFADLTSFYISLGKSNSSNSLYIYIPREDNALCDNGVTLKPNDNSTYLTEDNYVVRSVIIPKNTILPDNAWKNLNDISSDYIVREIHLEKDGKETQPQNTVQLSVPIPDEYINMPFCYIFWVKDDGTLESIVAARHGNYLVFNVDHFSYYAIVATNDAIKTVTTTKKKTVTATKVTTIAKTTRSAKLVAKDKKAAQKVMKQAKIKKLTAKSNAKKKITVTWKKVSKAKGYEVQVSTNKKFKKKKIVLSQLTTKKKLTIKSKKLKSGKTYYVRVRAYATYKDKNGKAQKVYSAWNKQIRKVKVK